MATKSKTTTKRRTFRQFIGEMIGKITPAESTFSTLAARYSLFSDKPITIDKSKVDYNLMKSIYWATPMTIEGKTYGEDYFLGAVFAKPIVNAAAAFVIGDIPTIAFDSEQESILEAEMILNIDFRDIKAEIMEWVKGAYWAGDGYIIFEDGVPRSLDPGIVEKIVDNRTGDVLGYDLNFVVSEEQDNETNKKINYRTEIRKTSEVTYRIEDDNETVEREEQFGEEQPFRIISYHNEPDPMAVYGNSEFQSCLHLFARYHALEEGSIKNVIYNSAPTPVFENIENIAQFMQINGTLNAETGQYDLNWNKEKIILGGTGFHAEMMSASNIATDAGLLMNILFWQICQSSETPEFVFGTAVQSSKASVSEQMPIMVKKAERKQAQLTKPLRELIDYMIWFNPEYAILSGVDYNVDFNPITTKDLAVNLNIAVGLLNAGVITKETAAKLCEIDEMVPDIKAEVAMATKEYDKEMKAAAVYSMPAGANPNDGGTADTKTNQTNQENKTEDETVSKEVTK